MTPLEPGCLVVCIAGHPENVGKTARLERYVGSVHGFRWDDLWQTDREWLYRNTLDFHARSHHPLISGRQVMRIDGWKETETREKEVAHEQ